MPYIGNIVQDFSVNNAMLNTDSVTSIKIDDGTIVNADINASAAIDGSKISPTFTSNIIISNTAPILTFTDTDTDDDFSIRGSLGKLRIRSNTDGADRFTVNSDGHIDIPGNLDVGAGIDVTGAIGATGNITSSAGEISTTNGSVIANKGTNNQVILGHDGAVEISRNGGGAFIDFKNDPSEDHDARIQENSGGFDLSGNVNIASGCDVTGAITGTGDLTIDTNTLHVDSSNNRVGIGTTGPTTKFHVLDTTKTSTTARDNTIARFLSNGSNADCNIQLSNGVDHSAQLGIVGDGAEFYIAQDGNERLRITSVGRLGIGTTSPSEQLETVGNIRATTNGSDNSIILNHTGSIEMTRSGGPFIDFKDASEDHDCRIKQESDGLAFTTGGQGSASERLRIDSSGRLLINNSSSTNAKLVVEDTSFQISLETGTSGDGRLVIGHFNNGAFIGTYGDDGGAADLIRFGTHSGDERMRIQSDGKVGIGTSGPSNDVHIQTANSGGDVALRITNVTSNDSSTASLYFTTSPSVTFNTSYIQAVRDGGKLNFGYATNSPTLCMHVSVDRVGIGNTGPEAKLDIESPTLGATSGNQQDLLKLKSPDVTNNTRYIFRNFRFTNGSSHTSSELRFFRKVDSTDMGYVGLRDSAITFGYGANEGMRMASDRTFSIGRTSSEGSQLMVDNQGEGRNSIRISQAHQTALAQFTEISNASYAGDGFKYHVSRAANSAFNFMAFDSAHASTPDREFTIRGDGNAFADGTWNNNGADYAEFFESSTGSVIPVGTTVVLENNKVRAATSSDAVGNIIGVVRPKEPGQASMTIGNTAWNKWQGKYLTDDFDRFILDEHTVINWTDADGTFHSYESHAIPSDVTVPSDATTLTTDAKGNKFTHYRLNPAYDSSKTYVPREDRDEWVIIGLVGQVKVLKGEVVNDRWIKMRDVSDTVEEYFIR